VSASSLALYSKDFIDESHKRFMCVLCLSKKGMVIIVKKYHVIIAVLLLCLIGAVYRIFSLQEQIYREETARQELSDQKIEAFFKPDNEPFVVDERLNRGLGGEY
jgi:hypothetical protein